jgi:hypothetical protein
MRATLPPLYSAASLHQSLSPVICKCLLFEIFAELVMKNAVFWFVSPCKMEVLRSSET